MKWTLLGRTRGDAGDAHDTQLVRRGFREEKDPTARLFCKDVAGEIPGFKLLRTTAVPPFEDVSHQMPCTPSSCRRIPLTSIGDGIPATGRVGEDRELRASPRLWLPPSSFGGVFAAVRTYIYHVHAGRRSLLRLRRPSAKCHLTTIRADRGSSLISSGWPLDTACFR